MTWKVEVLKRSYPPFSFPLQSSFVSFSPNLSPNMLVALHWKMTGEEEVSGGS